MVDQGGLLGGGDTCELPEFVKKWSKEQQETRGPKALFLQDIGITKVAQRWQAWVWLEQRLFVGVWKWVGRGDS